MSTSPPRDKIKQYPYLAGSNPVSGWTVDTVTSALTQHQQGLFTMSGALSEDMGNNPWIRHCLDRRAECFTTTPLVVTAAPGGEQCADFVREALHDILPLTTLKELHRQYIMMGFAVAAVNWIETSGMWIPQIMPWQPQMIQYQHTTDGGSFVASTANHGMVRVTPGDSRWLVITQSPLRPWRHGAVMTLAEAYLGDAYNFRDNMAFQDKFGRGIFLLRHPVAWKDDEILTAANSLRVGQGGGVLPCPVTQRGEKLVDLELVQADSTGFKTFDATENRVKTRIFITLLGQNMTSEGDTGGYAQAKVHAHGLWRVFESDLAQFGDAVLSMRDMRTRDWRPRTGVLRGQILKWLAFWNFGDESLAPYVWWHAIQPDDLDIQKELEIKQLHAKTQALSVAVEAVQHFGAGVLDFLGLPKDLILRENKKS